MNATRLPANYIAASVAKLAGPMGYIHGLMIVIPGSIYFLPNDGGEAMFVPVNRSGIWATLDDNAELLVQVGPEGEHVVRTGGIGTELQRLGVPTYHNGRRVNYSLAPEVGADAE